MAFEKAKAYLERYGLADRIIVTEHSSATVTAAAETIGCEPAMIAKTLEVGDALLIGKFLVPEVAQAIGATVEDILPLESLLPKLDAKHQYEAVIFEAIKTNGTFTLTDRQRQEAFRQYQLARTKEKE